MALAGLFDFAARHQEEKVLNFVVIGWMFTSVLPREVGERVCATRFIKRRLAINPF